MRGTRGASWKARWPIACALMPASTNRQESFVLIVKALLAAPSVVAEVPPSEVHQDEEQDDGGCQGAAEIHPPWRAL